MKNEIQLTNILETTLETLSWIMDLDDWKTFDPYDLKATPLAMNLAASPTRLGRTATRILHWTSLVAPQLVRCLFGVKPVVTASGLAYTLSGLSRLYNCGISSLEESLEVFCQDAFRTLMMLRNPTKGWGLPFAWYTSQGVTIPANATLSYTTYTVVEALMDYYETNLCDEALQVAISALVASVEELNASRVGNGTALSYSRFDNYQVINTNALLAGAIARVSSHATVNGLSELARDMITFVINTQSCDGSWPYFASGGVIDNYHTAMTIQGLTEYYVNTNEQVCDLGDTIRCGMDFYLRHFIDNDGRPVLSVKRSNVVDIAGCAECIELLWRYAPALKKLGLDRSVGMMTVGWAIDHMLQPSGEWLYRKYGRIPVKLGSLRWGQAMMFRSLASVCMELSSKAKKPMV